MTETAGKKSCGDILERFVELLPLDDALRLELQVKRAIPADWARRLKLCRISSDHSRKAIQTVIDEFGALAVRAAGLTDEHQQPIKVLLAENVLIPYLDEGGLVQKIRPHKLGLPGDPVAVYCPFLLAQSKVTEIILTEGEFKALASCAAGFPCIAVPGISSFVGEHYPELRDLLKRHGVRSVTVCFDNTDPKNADPAYPSGRDQTNYYALLMAKMLTEDGF